MKVFNIVNPNVNSSEKFLIKKRNRSTQKVESNESRNNETNTNRRFHQQRENTNQLDNSNIVIISNRKNKSKENIFWSKKKEKYIQINKASMKRNNFQSQKNEIREKNNNDPEEENPVNIIDLKNKNEASQNNNRNKIIIKNSRRNISFDSYIEKILKKRDSKFKKKFKI